MSIVGYELNTFLWLDNWHPLGPLKAWFGERMDHNLLRNLSTKVASIIRGNSWHPIVKEILDSIPATVLPNSTKDDSVIFVIYLTCNFC